MNDVPLKKCSLCHSDNSLVRIISGGTGLIFKGSGFYKTDYPDEKKIKKKTKNKIKGKSDGKS
tara:strand:+ start:147 stop:335 length:189 start_codon:yes stop_codon:yes gene_type:complete